MLFLVSLVNEILHLRDSSLKYITSLVAILPATLISERLCIQNISHITTRIESGMLKHIHSELALVAYSEDAKLAMSMNAAILYIVNGMALTYIWHNIINLCQFVNLE